MPEKEITSNFNMLFSILEMANKLLWEEAHVLMQLRHKLRKENKFEDADNIREVLEKIGVYFDDYPNGKEVRRGKTKYKIMEFFDA